MRLEQVAEQAYRISAWAGRPAPPRCLAPWGPHRLHPGKVTTGNHSSRGITQRTHHSHPRSKIEQETLASPMSLELIVAIGALLGALKPGAFETPNGRLVSGGSER